MIPNPQILSILTVFGLMSLAAKEIGRAFSRFGLPLISGFLIVGALIGPQLLGVIDVNSLAFLHFIDSFALAFIAMAAGSELLLSDLRTQWRSLLSIILGQTVAVYIFIIPVFLAFSGMIPILQGMSRSAVFAAAVLGTTIMVARSPASAYAIIKELRARGPFTQRAFGATVLKDGVVIILFAVAVSVARSSLQGAAFDFRLIGVILLGIFLDLCVGIGLGLLLRLVLQFRIAQGFKTAAMLCFGYGIFVAPEYLLQFTGHRLISEPLLVCLLAGFFVSNFTPFRVEFHQIIEKVAPPMFVLFFTHVGMGMNLEVLKAAWLTVLILCLVRILGIFVGCFAGGALAGDPLRQNMLLGLAFVTQAGVSVGLAKEVADEFQPWGADLATLVIGVIIVNQFIGPPLFKWAIKLAHEAHPPAEVPAFDGHRDVMIFGAGLRARALARSLQRHGWGVTLLVPRDYELPPNLGDLARQLRIVPELEPGMLKDISASKADAMVAMLPSDDLNYRVCELFYENVGTANLIAFLRDPASMPRFQAMGVSVVEPRTAAMNLLDHLVRAPALTSTLLGQHPEQDVADLTVQTADLDGAVIRDLHLPDDVLVLAIRRDGDTLVAHGHTRLKVGDRITVYGTPQSLEDLQLRLEGLQSWNRDPTSIL